MKIKMLMAFVALLLFSAFTADRTITIFMIGDSTICLLYTSDAADE